MVALAVSPSLCVNSSSCICADSASASLLLSNFSLSRTHICTGSSSKPYIVCISSSLTEDTNTDDARSFFLSHAAFAANAALFSAGVEPAGAVAGGDNSVPSTNLQHSITFNAAFSFMAHER